MGVVYSTGLSRGLFLDRDLLGRPLPWVVENRGIEYPGEVILAEAVDPRWGESLSGGLRFRVVFYTVPRRIPTGHIKDRRIVMAVPRAADPDRESLGHELQSIREARPHYVPSHDPGASAVRGSLEDSEAAMREYNRRFSSEGIRRILSDPSKQQLDKFINLVQVSDLTGLAGVLDDDALDFLRGFINPI